MSLEADLRSLDGRSYKAYRDLDSFYQVAGFTLHFNRIQGDPFAAPSQCRISIPQSIAGFPEDLFSTSSREIALRDYINRQCDRNCRRFSSRSGSGKSGVLAIAQPSQAILERTAVFIDRDRVEV